MLRIDIETARTAHDIEPCRRARHEIRQVLTRLRVQRQRLRSVRAKSVNDGIKTRQILFCECHDVLLHEILYRALVLAPCKACHRMAACDQLRNDCLACLSIGCYNCNFHVTYLRKIFCN